MKFIKVILPVILILFLCSCHNDKNEGINNIIKYAITISDNNYTIEDLDWNMTKDEVLNKKELTEKSVESIPGDLDNVRIRSKIKYLSPKVDIDVLYIFEDNKLIGGDYIFNLQTKEEYILICEQLTKQAKDYMPTSDGNNLDNLKEDKVVSWIGDNKSSVRITVPNNLNDLQYTIILSVRAQFK